MFECSRPELRVLANSDSEMQTFESERIYRITVNLLAAERRFGSKGDRVSAERVRALRAVHA